jgi:hypothetical protein
MSDWDLTFKTRPFKRGAELLAYAHDRKLSLDDAVLELVNAALDYGVPDNAIVGFNPLVTETFQERLTRTYNAGREKGAADGLGPVRDAMRTYESAIGMGQHGGMAAAALIDAVYAILNPAVVASGVAEAAEHERVVWGDAAAAHEQPDAVWGMGSVNDDPGARRDLLPHPRRGLPRRPRQPLQLRREDDFQPDTRRILSSTT